jgi:hypothetical protein
MGRRPWTKTHTAAKCGKYNSPARAQAARAQHDLGVATRNSFRDIPDVAAAAGKLGLQFQVVQAGSDNEIDAAFARLGRERAPALVVANDAFLTLRRSQIVALAAHYALPAICNLEASKTLGLDMPAKLLALADEVIERLAAHLGGKPTLGDPYRALAPKFCCAAQHCLIW